MALVTDHALRIINDCLANDEGSTDEELVDVLIANGVDQTIAKQAIQFRDRFFIDFYAKVGYVNEKLVLVK